MIFHKRNTQQLTRQNSWFRHTNRLIFLSFFLLAATAHGDTLEAHKPVIIFVPGFLNGVVHSIDGHYFADEIIAHYQNAGAEVLTINEELQSTGEVEDNGRRLQRTLEQKWSNPEYKNRPIEIVAHSAGALFSLYAATHSDLPITKIISISSPWRGADIVDKTPLNVLAKLLDQAQVKALIQYKREKIEPLIGQWPARRNLKIFCLAGQQNLDWRRANRAEYLSWPLSVAQSFIDKASDGVISVDSALPASSPSKPEWLDKWDFVDTSAYPRLPLDHMEQAHKSEIFRLLGVSNPEYIRNAQLSFYDFLLHSILEVRNH